LESGCSRASNEPAHAPNGRRLHPERGRRRGGTPWPNQNFGKVDSKPAGAGAVCTPARARVGGGGGVSCRACRSTVATTRRACLRSARGPFECGAPPSSAVGRHAGPPPALARLFHAPSLVILCPRAHYPRPLLLGLPRLRQLVRRGRISLALPRPPSAVGRGVDAGVRCAT